MKKYKSLPPTEFYLVSVPSPRTFLNGTALNINVEVSKHTSLKISPTNMIWIEIINKTKENNKIKIIKKNNCVKS
jgi:hypothetical protein